MARYYIVTRNRDAYVIQEDGTVEAYNSYGPSVGWKITGVAERRPFGRLQLHGLSKLVELSHHGHLSWKNGKAKFTLTDIYHGTRRIHGNMSHHGISYIETLD